MHRSNLYSLGTMLKEIRIELGYTQKDIATALNCSQVLISHIEKGEREVADDMLLALSTIYRIDLQDYKANYVKFKNVSHYKHFYDLTANIQYPHTLGILKSLLEKDITKEFNYGEPLFLKTYCEAIIELYLTFDYEKCQKICLSGLNSTIEELKTSKLKTLKSTFYYSILKVLIMCLYEQSNVPLALELSEKYISYLDSIYSEDSYRYIKQNIFMCETYISLIANYAYFSFREKNYEKAIELSDIALKKAKNLNTQTAVRMLLKVKASSLYMLEEYDKAKTVFEYFKVYCQYTENAKYSTDKEKDSDEDCKAMLE